MKRISLLIAAIAVLGSFLNSCIEPVDPTDKYEVIYVTDDITTPTTWLTEKAYVIQKTNFEVASSLTIEPGAVIKFSSSFAYLTLTGDGTINAVGNSNKPIIFTSLKDDSHGGDSNNDGDNSTAQVQDWGTIDLNGTTGCVFKYCEFRYGGMGVNAEPTLELSANASAVIENCKFINNGGGVRQSGNITSYKGALHAESASNQTVIINNTFYNNVLPLTIFAEIDIDDSNTFSYFNNTNTMNGIYVCGNRIMKTTNWMETEVAFVITPFDLIIQEPYKLVLGNDVGLKFVGDSRLNCGGGVAALENYDGDGVFFTSIKDDVRKGDTNGDGAQTSPEIADWLGIFLDDFKAGNYANWQNIFYNDPNVVVKKDL